MSDVVEAVDARILAYAAVSAQIGTSLFHQWPAQTDVLPYVVAEWTDDDIEYSQAGETGPTTELLMLRVYSSSYAQARLIRTALRDCLSGYSGTTSSVVIRAIFRTQGGDAAPDPRFGQEFGTYCIECPYRVIYAEDRPAL